MVDNFYFSKYDLVATTLIPSLFPPCRPRTPFATLFGTRLFFHIYSFYFPPAKLASASTAFYLAQKQKQQQQQSPPNSPRPFRVVDAGGGGEDGDGMVPRGGINSPKGLLCEGYLRKIRGFAQNRMRWFQLTDTRLTFYTKDGGELISSVKREDIVRVEEHEGRRITLTTGVPFGASGQSEMMLECESAAARIKWMLCLGQKSSEKGFRADGGRLLAEGYLVKQQPLGIGLNRRRWFVLTDKTFSYFSAEAGVEMAHVDVDKILAVRRTSFSSFILRASEPFSKSGKETVTVQADSPSACVRWLRALASVLEGEGRPLGFTPLPESGKTTAQHVGSARKQSLVEAYNGETTRANGSQGNRFICDGDL